MSPVLRLAAAGTAALAAAAPLAAQRIPLDLSLGAGSGAQRGALSTWRSFLAPVPIVRLGVGVRVTAYGGDPAPYSNRGTKQGNLAGSVTIEPAVYALNGAAFGELRLVPAVALGANLDLVGLATGARRSPSAQLSAKPATASAFLYAKNDRGSLNSEFYVAVALGPRLRARAGMSHYVTGYTVTDNATAGAPAARYQRFETVPFVAVTIDP